MNRRNMLIGSLAVPAVSLWAADAGAHDRDALIVTGDVGVVGSKLVPSLGAGKIIGVDRKRGSHQDLNNPHGKWVEQLSEAKAVIHLAWEIIWDNPDAWDIVYQQKAIDATMNLFAACRAAKVPLVIFASTMGVSLKPDGVSSIPHGPMYASAKRFAEDALQTMVWEGAFAAVAVRIARVNPPSAASKLPDDDVADLFGRALAVTKGYSVFQAVSK